MLAAGDQLLTTIAVGVGFSTPAGLTRAVRRWTGMTPTQYRNQPPVGSLKPAP